MTENKAVDKAVVDTLKGLMKDRFNFLIETFFTKMTDQLVELEQAIGNKDQDSIVSITHAIKGSAGSVGAQNIHLLCKDFETQARSGDLSKSADWASALSTEFERYKNEIQSYL